MKNFFMSLRFLLITYVLFISVIGNHDQDGKALYRRKWEENFGPTDYSFNRGDEHYVCINNCFFYRGTAYYSPGELRERQMQWLKQDLALTPKDKKVVLCYHIPFTFGNSPFGKAKPLGIESEKGHYSSSRLSQLLQLLKEFEGGYDFCRSKHAKPMEVARYNLCSSLEKARLQSGMGSMPRLSKRACSSSKVRTQSTYSLTSGSCPSAFFAVQGPIP